MKIYYHNDLDGRCAAAITWRAIKLEERYKKEKVELIEVDYKDEIKVKEINLCEQIYILDFSFKPEVMEKVLLLTKNIVWIDHHKTALAYKYSQELRGKRDVNFSGCELAWKYFHGEKQMPRAAELIGDRDKWVWKLGKETSPFNVGLKLYDNQPKDEVWDRLFNFPARLLEVPDIVKKGELCLKFRDQFCKDYCNSYGFETKFEGYKCFALGIYMFGSEAFGNRINEYDVLLSFAYSGRSWTVGLYSDKVDVSKIAVKYGGGGNIKAAGFVCKELPFRKIQCSD